MLSLQLLDYGQYCILRDLCWLLWNHVSHEHCHVCCGNDANLWKKWKTEQPDYAGRDPKESS